jgi:ABC-2 type transport system permease protein
MSRVAIVLRKEFRELVAARSTVITGIVLSGYFGLTYAVRLGAQTVLPIELSLGSLLFLLTTVLGVFLGYVFCSQVFLREKMDAVIETLLCSPVTLREIWLGKTLAITALADLLSVASGLLCALVVSYHSGAVVIPNGATIFHVVLVLPMVVACLVGALGFAQLLLGMKENRIIGIVVFAAVFGALFGLGFVSSGGLAVTWLRVGLLGLGAAMVLAGLSYASLRLSKERIVTTLS